MRGGLVCLIETISGYSSPWLGAVASLLQPSRYSPPSPCVTAEPGHRRYRFADRLSNPVEPGGPSALRQGAKPAPRPSGRPSPCPDAGRRGCDRARRAAAEPGCRNDCRVRAGGQRDGALPRGVPQQRDVDAHRLGRAVGGGQRPRPYRPANARASRAGPGVCGGRADGGDRHRLPPLQHHQEAGRVLLAEPVLFGPDRRPGGAVVVGPDGLPVRTGARQPARHSRPRWLASPRGGPSRR